jgi:hypothetical protein
MIPENAFQEAQNVFFYLGRVHKRKGFEAFAEGTLIWECEFQSGENLPNVGDSLVTATETDGAAFVSVNVTSGAWATNDAAGTFRVSKATQPAYADTEACTNDDESNTFGDIVGTAYAKGVRQLSVPPVMGIYEFYTIAGSSSLIAFDKGYLYTYDATNDVWIGAAGFDTSTPDFTGDDDNFFWVESVGRGQLGAANDLIIIANDVDACKAWDGSSFTDLDTGNLPDSALFVVHHKNRLIFLNTVESGQRHPQRARCTNVGTYNNGSDDIYVDADTIDWINGVSFVRGELLVWFERSVWWLRYTGDDDNPFGWLRIAETEGSYAPYSVTNFEDESIALGPTSWVGCDGLSVYGIDDQIPDLVLTMNQDALQYAYGLMVEELRQYICSYPALGSTYANRLLCLNYKDNAFSIYHMAFHVAGYWSQDTDQTINETNTIINSTTYLIDTVTKTAGYPLTMSGDTSGNIRTLFVGDDDNGTVIESKLKTRRLLFFPNQLAKLGYVDIIGDAGALQFNLKIYKDYRDTPFFTQTVSMSDDEGRDKVRKRVRVMERGTSFVIEITENEADNPWAIDAIIPYCKPAGNIV